MRDEEGTEEGPEEEQVSFANESGSQRGARRGGRPAFVWQRGNAASAFAGSSGTASGVRRLSIADRRLVPFQLFGANSPFDLPGNPSPQVARVARVPATIPDALEHIGVVHRLNKLERHL